MELLWLWQEAYEEFGIPAKGFGSSSYIYNDILCVAQSNLSYGIDMNTGQTLWKNRDEKGISYVKGINNSIISKTHRIFNEDAQIRVADVDNGEWINVYDFVKEDSLSVQLTPPFPFTWKGKSYMCFVSSKWYAGLPIRIYWLNLYNLTEDKLEWTSDTIPLETSS